jgi:hypothetical protein
LGTNTDHQYDPTLVLELQYYVLRKYRILAKSRIVYITL